MITAYSFVEGLPCRTDDLEAADWLDVVAPTDEDVEALRGHFGISVDFSRAPLDVHERPRIETEGETTLVLLRVPHADTGKRALIFATRPLAVIVTPTKVITCSDREDLVPPYFTRKLRPACRTSAAAALSLLLRIGADFIKHLELLDGRIEGMERGLRTSMRNEELLGLLRLEKTLIYFTMALKGNLAVLERLGRLPEHPLCPGDAALWEDAVIETRQAADMADIYRQTLSGLADAMGAVVSNNLNGAMKFLTGMTIVMMIPAILTGLYGMNVALPFAGEPWAFPAVGGVCFGLCAGTILYFRRKNWL
jgi:magnesium transporter